MEKIFIINGEEIKVQDYQLNGEKLEFTLHGQKHFYMLIARDQEMTILDNGGRFSAFVSSPNPEGESVVFSNGLEAMGSNSGKKMKRHHLQGGAGLKSPMPGKIFKILKQLGDQVKKGEPILILEAMKMEHAIRSDKDGVLKKIHFKMGELVQGGVTLAEVEG
jgi:3-methylcrotonyl-CoA carboxylase alpha subunit